MSNDKNKKPIKKIGSKMIEWNNNSLDISAQNNMSDRHNEYNHVTQPNNQTDGKVRNLDGSKVAIINRGSDNLAPQKDLELGRRSITHRKIAEGMADLVAGSGLAFELKNKPIDREPTDMELLQLEMAKSFLDLGLNKALPVLANGISYFRLASMVVTQDTPKLNDKLRAVTPNPIWFEAKPSEQLRFGVPRMNEKGQTIVDIHAYHEDWGFYGNDGQYECRNGIGIIPIVDFITKSSEGKIKPPSEDNAYENIPAYYVKTMQSEKSKMQRFVSHSFGAGRGTFDNAYPLPSWKSNSSINDIQCEFEASCIRIDYLRNGLHIFAIINVYSSSFATTVAPEDSEEQGDKWLESLDVIQGLRKSFNSGKILVNPIVTTDTEKDGKIEIEKVDLQFPVDTVRFFNEEARASILTAWGVLPDLFSISKPEKSNLKSQEGFMNVGIVLLQDKVKAQQGYIEDGIDEVLAYYGLDLVKSRIVPKDNNAFIVTLKDFAKDYMDFNEIRTKILGESEKTTEEITALAEQKNIFLGKMAAQGVVVSPNA